jgi:hypothetical protein
MKCDVKRAQKGFVLEMKDGCVYMNDEIEGEDLSKLAAHIQRWFMFRTSEIIFNSDFSDISFTVTIDSTNRAK